MKTSNKSLKQILLSAIFSFFAPDPFPVPAAAANDVVRQREAFQNLGLSDQDLHSKKELLADSAQNFYSIALISFVMMLYFIFNYLPLQWIATVGMFAVSAGCAWLGMLRAYRFWQIDTQMLSTFAEFLDTPTAWIP